MVQGGETHSESWYTQQWATTLDGDIEVTNPDGTRTDILTATHAIEVEFADHWTEALGQSLHYALQQERTPGIVLILRSEKDRRYAERLNCVIEHFLPGNTVRVWIQDPPVESPVTPVTAESSYVSTTHTPSFSAGWSNGYSGYSRSTDWGEVFGAIMAVILFLLFVFLILAALMAIFEAIGRYFMPEFTEENYTTTSGSRWIIIKTHNTRKVRKS